MTGALTGKIAIVTGAGRGIGRAIAEEYAAEGAKVVLASRTQRTVDDVADTIRAAGGDAISVACDVGEKADVLRAVDAAMTRWGGVDILVNNAQSFGTRANPQGKSPASPVESVSEDEWDWVYTTGLKATLWSMQAVFPSMKARGGGCVINFGSARGILSTPGTAAYNSTKEAIRGLSRTAAKEWGAYGIRVNVINPVIETDAYREDVPTEEMRAQFETTIPLRKIGQPRDAARIAVFLASADAGYLTGMTFNVDGGFISLP